jgi:hypothetical protein
MLREEHRLRVLRRIFGPKGKENEGTGENCIMRSFLNCRLHQMLLERSKQGK